MKLKLGFYRETWKHHSRLLLNERWEKKVMIQKMKKWGMLVICLGMMLLSVHVTEAAENGYPQLEISATGNSKGTTVHWFTEGFPRASDYPGVESIGYEVEIAKKADFANAQTIHADKDTWNATIPRKQFGAEGGKLYARVRFAATMENGETEYGKWSDVKELVFVKISKKNFPGMYKTLKQGDGEHYSDAEWKKLINGQPAKAQKYQYDKNKDGWLDQEEIDWLYSLDTKDTKVSSLQGIEYFTHLSSISLAQFSGTKIDLTKNKVSYVNVRGITSKKIKVIAPEAKSVFIEADYWKNQLSEIDVSSCDSVEKLNVENWNPVVKNIKLPKEKKKITELSIRGFCGSTLNVNAYTKLVELSILGCKNSKIKLDKCKQLKYLYFYACSNIRSLDLTKNTKLKYVDFYGCSKISLNAVKRPKNTKATTGKGCYWWSTKAYRKDMGQS